MVDVFDEVEEEMRRERYNKAFRQWAPWVIGGAVAIVAGVAGYQYWSYQSNATAEAAANAFFEASELFDNGDLDGASAAFTVMAEDGPVGYSTISYMRLGEIALAENNSAEAARYFEQAAARAPEPLTRELAQFKAALALFDELSYDDLSLRLTPLTEGDAQFGLIARELMAAAAMRDERWEEARTQYELLSISLDLPPGMSDQPLQNGDVDYGRISQALAYIDQNAPRASLDTSIDGGDSLTPAQVGELEVDGEPSADPDDTNGAAPDSDSEEGGQ